MRMRQVASKRFGSLQKREAEFIEPMECAPVTKLPNGPEWIYEIRLDGYRAVAVKSDRGVNLYSRRHKSFNHQYPHLVEALGELPEGTVVVSRCTFKPKCMHRTIDSHALKIPAPKGRNFH
ncbi:MAG: hypothetical protein DMG38_18790 [Acidobacteria bacterium]|nr:MAG: hypothetical protein DMG38_18790 [Acidobacteriota bacterium]